MTWLTTSWGSYYALVPSEPDLKSVSACRIGLVTPVNQSINIVSRDGILRNIIPRNNSARYNFPGTDYFTTSRRVAGVSSKSRSASEHTTGLVAVPSQRPQSEFGTLRAP